MKRLTALLLPLFVPLLLAGCASLPPPAVDLFHDDLFAAPSQPVSEAGIFAMSDEMKRYVDTEIAYQLRTQGAQRGLLDALYTKQQLKLEYDAERTRNAAEAFDARAGNCLSLVIMTAAFAKHLGMQVTYQHVYADETWTRNADTYFASNHVNVTLGRRWFDTPNRSVEPTWTIDFLPSDSLQGQRARTIDETTVAAMYMNNRAVESMAAGALNDAYAWAKAAIVHTPGFMSAYNTLGVVYLRRGQPALAERALAQVLLRDPSNTVALSNMVRSLSLQGRTEESATLQRQLARLDPEPPYHFFDRGRAAMDAGDYQAARDLFSRELQRAPYHHEFHFWMAMAAYRLGDEASARKHLSVAMSTSTTRNKQKLYSAKLEQLKQAQKKAGG